MIKELALIDHNDLEPLGCFAIARNDEIRVRLIILYCIITDSNLVIARHEAIQGSVHGVFMSKIKS